MFDIKSAPLRVSFAKDYLNCGRYAKFNAESNKGKPHYFLGGSVIAEMVDLFHKGLTGSIAADELAALCWQNLMNTGAFICSDYHRNIIISRCAQAFEGYMYWFSEQGFTILGSELTLRHAGFGGKDYASKLDLLVINKKDELCILDGKSHGMWGKGISLPKFTEDQLKRDLQLALYALLLQGGRLLNCSCDRYASGDSCSCPSVDIDLVPDRIGFIEYAYLIPYYTGDKKGQPRGNPLLTIPYSPARGEYAREVMEYVGFNVSLGLYPRVRRYARGQDNCDNCAFKDRCFSDFAKESKPVLPDFLKGK